MPDEVSCRRAARLLSAAIDRELSLKERALLELHLVACLHCRNYEVQLKFLRKAAGRLHSDEG